MVEPQEGSIERAIKSQPDEPAKNETSNLNEHGLEQHELEHHLAGAYHCPNCKTNKTRFNLIKQEAIPIRMDADTGSILTKYTPESLSPFHLQYQGPSFKVQCGVCGLLENEEMFAHYAEYVRKENS